KKQTGPTWRQIHAKDKMPEESHKKIKQKGYGRENPDHVSKPERSTGKTGDAVDSKPQHLHEIEFGRSGKPLGPVILDARSAKTHPADHPAQVHDLVTHGKQTVQCAAAH